MKLATWNVALPVAPGRQKALRGIIDQIQADVYVLTETHDTFAPGYDFSCSSAAGRDGVHPSAHRWVTIWTNHQVEPLVTTDVKRTAAARVFPRNDTPFIVYGTVLPWIGSKWEGHDSKGGVAFREALHVQAGDWQRLRREYADDEFFILGDFNQDLVACRPRYYGSLANRKLLEEALANVGMFAITAGEGDPIRRDSAPYACIDHICMRTDSKWHMNATMRWPDLPKPPRKLSDHFGVAVGLVLRGT